MPKRQRRYQYWGPNGLQWTDWYDLPAGAVEDKWELKNKLKAEYRDAPANTFLCEI